MQIFHGGRLFFVLLTSLGGPLFEVVLDVVGHHFLSQTFVIADPVSPETHHKHLE